MSSNYTDGIAGTVVTIVAFSIVGGIALMIIVGSVAFGAIVGGAAGAGLRGYQYYKKKKKESLWSAAADATGFGMFEPGGIFLGEDVKWK